MRIFKQDKLFIAVIVVILIAGLYFFAAYVPIKYEIRKDYTGMEYTSDMSIVSDTVNLHIFGYYYDYILETHNSDYFRGKFEVSSVAETINNEAHFLMHDSLMKPNGDKKEFSMYYPIVDGVVGHVFMEKQFLKMFIQLSDSYQNNILIFPAKNQEQAAGVYNELESILYGSNLKNLFSK